MVTQPVSGQGLPSVPRLRFQSQTLKSKTYLAPTTHWPLFWVLC